MLDPLHPNKALFETTTTLPIIPTCDHYAGSEKLLIKSLELQSTLGPIFDITCDLEDGAKRGEEKLLLESFIKLLLSDKNTHHMAGIRIHDHHSQLWKYELEQIVANVGNIISHITIPKIEHINHLKEMLEYLQSLCNKTGVKGHIPVHVLIESHSALAQVWDIAKLPWLRGLDFGIMDFISCHRGAIPACCINSPGQFTHHLITRAKTEIAAAALANNLIPSHNVTTNYTDPNVVKADAEQARNSFGFMRMWSIHPSQISVIVSAMSPSYNEVKQAANILLSGYAKAWAPITIDGNLHDRASFRYFWDLIQKARLNGIDIGQEAENTFFNKS